MIDQHTPSTGSWRIDFARFLVINFFYGISFSLEGTLKVISLLISIVGGVFLALNQIHIWSKRKRD